MDTWTVTQYHMMRNGGNDAQHKFFDKYGVSKFAPARQKYDHPVAAAYRDKLKCVTDGKEWKKPKGLTSSSGNSGRSVSSSSGTRSTESAGGFAGAVGANAGTSADAGANHQSFTQQSGSKNPKGGAFDLATGTGSLLSKAYVRDGETHADGWKPPPPKPPRGAIEGKFLMGLSPENWVFFLKRLDRQGTRCVSQIKRRLFADTILTLFVRQTQRRPDVPFKEIDRKRTRASRGVHVWFGAAADCN